MSEDYTNNVKTLGISHIFAISGLHIIILYTIFNKLFGIFKINRKIISWLSLFLIAIYGYAVGLPSSILRAFIMLVIVELSNQMQIDWYNLNNLIIAAILILLMNPYNLFDVGFIFSFLATFTILYLYPKFKKQNSKLRNYLMLSSLVYIILLPIQLRFFNEFTFGFIIGNTIILPIFTLIIQLSAIVLLIPNSFNYVFVQIIKFCLKIINYIFITINSFNIQIHSFMSFSILMIFVYYIIIFEIYNRHYIKTLNDFNKQTLKNMFFISVIMPIILNIFNPITHINFVDIKVIDKPISDEENDKSIVYKVYVNDISLLITGDISREYERNILNEDITSDVLKISHHGSKNSSDLNFLKKVNPKISIISVGLRNDYGHPHHETLDNLNKLNIPIKRTDKDGNIEIVSSKIFNTIRSNRDKYSIYNILVKEQNSIITTIFVLYYFKSRGAKDGFFIGETKIR